MISGEVFLKGLTEVEIDYWIHWVLIYWGSPLHALRANLVCPISETNAHKRSKCELFKGQD